MPTCATLAATMLSALCHPAELAWQSLNVLDAVQTDRIRSRQDLEETYPLTRALIGAEPSRGEVVAWAAGGALLHAAVSSYLLNTERTRAYRVWQFVTLTEKGIAVSINLSHGLP